MPLEKKCLHAESCLEFCYAIIGKHVLKFPRTQIDFKKASFFSTYFIQLLWEIVLYQVEKRLKNSVPQN